MASRENALGRLHRHRHRRRLSLGHEQHALELGHRDRCTVPDSDDLNIKK
jgi:hypothetical protein